MEPNYDSFNRVLSDAFSDISAVPVKGTRSDETATIPLGTTEELTGYLTGVVDSTLADLGYQKSDLSAKQKRDIATQLALTTPPGARLDDPQLSAALNTIVLSELGRAGRPSAQVLVSTGAANSLPPAKIKALNEAVLPLFETLSSGGFYLEPEHGWEAFIKRLRKTESPEAALAMYGEFLENCDKAQDALLTAYGSFPTAGKDFLNNSAVVDLLKRFHLKPTTKD